MITWMQTVYLAAVTPAPLGAAAAVPHKAAGAAGSTAAVPSSGATLSPDIIRQLTAAAQHKSGLAQNVPWLTHTFAAIFMICAVALITLLAFQTTKQEGLSGTIGGRVESSYRPRLGFDQQLARLTGVVAIGFVFFAVVLSITGI